MKNVLDELQASCLILSRLSNLKDVQFTDIQSGPYLCVSLENLFFK